jgi:LPXTG-site transpeptidase (sortase) family protein
MTFAGMLSIPSIGLHGVRVEKCSSGMPYQMLRCLEMNDTVQYPDHRMIAAHDYRTFRNLHRVKIGDKLRYARKAYEVYDKRIVHPNDVGVLNVPEDEIRFYTCTDGILRRLVVFARELK